MNRVLDDLESLSRLSNKANYDYTDEDVRKMFKAINEKVKITQQTFSDKIDGKRPFTLK